ncbi:MAG: hypothetical protein KatS3mg089_0241 [Patescibacteria group bacterium]|nr:MAG: hypothetical protein KatS3mg089_0241 [Patescibacteria group bacterium]
MEKSSINPKEREELAATSAGESSENKQRASKERYTALLSRYTQYTEQIRHMQYLMRPFDDIHQIDLKGSELHRKLEELGAKLGKDTEDIGLDILLHEGNLREYGINAPLIGLSLVGLTFRYREEEERLK